MVKNPTASAGDVGSSPGSGRSLQKEMATHSSILAWEIPWTEEPGGFSPWGCKRVRHNAAIKQPPPHFALQFLPSLVCVMHQQQKDSHCNSWLKLNITSNNLVSSFPNPFRRQGSCEFSFKNNILTDKIRSGQ